MKYHRNWFLFEVPFFVIAPLLLGILTKCDFMCFVKIVKKEEKQGEGKGKHTKSTKQSVVVGFLAM